MGILVLASQSYIVVRQSPLRTFLPVRESCLVLPKPFRALSRLYVLVWSCARTLLGYILLAWQACMVPCLTSPKLPAVCRPSCMVLCQLPWAVLCVHGHPVCCCSRPPRSLLLRVRHLRMVPSASLFGSMPVCMAHLYSTVPDPIFAAGFRLACDPAIILLERG